MNRDLLIKVMTGNAIDTGDLVGLYSFNEYSGIYTWNEKHVNPEAASINDGCVLGSSYPLYSLCGQNNVNLNSGSGYFDFDTVLQVGTSFPYSGWTIFVEYETEDFSKYSTPWDGQGRTLFSSMDGPNDTSGFNIGLNGAHKPYFEYANNVGVKKTLTLGAELGKRNILSFSKTSSSDLLEMTFHDPLYKNDKMSSHALSDSTTSADVDKTYRSQLFIGDFFTPDVNYTGFSGHFDNLIIYGNYMSSEQRNVVANSIVASDWLGNRTEPKQVVYASITGYTESTTGVTGQGITGYEYPTTGNITSRCGSDIDVCNKVAMAGDLTGISYSFATGSAMLTGTTYEAKKSEVIYDMEKMMKLKRNDLISFYPVENATDAYVIYNYTGIEKQLNLEATAVPGDKYFRLNDNTTGQDINFYVNGLYKISGSFSNGQLTDGEYHTSGADNERIAFEGEIISDNIEYDNIYDVIPGTVYTAEYVSGETQWGFPTTHTGKNIFLNGQKLLSGENYTDTASGPYIWRNTLNNQPTGELAFAPRGNFDARIQNSSTSLTTLADGYVTEQVWFNGQRLKRNKDYLLISENSLLNQGNLIEYNNRNYLYNGEEKGIIRT